MRYLLNFGDYSFFVDSKTGSSLTTGDEVVMEGEKYSVDSFVETADRIEVFFA